MYVITVHAGMSLFILGMAVNIHSDHILRSLRRTSDATDKMYKIPKGKYIIYSTVVVVR